MEPGFKASTFLYESVVHLSKKKVERARQCKHNSEIVAVTVHMVSGPKYRDMSWIATKSFRPNPSI